MESAFRFKLVGESCVFIDWGNVYGWTKSLKSEIDIKKLYAYLKEYKDINGIRFYYGEDKNDKSKDFLKEVERIGYEVVTKPVKYVKTPAGIKRKCDFDLEIGLDCFERLDDYKTFVFFSGDGDYYTLYERLIKRGKQVIVVYMYGHLGREVWLLKRGIYKISIIKLNLLKK